MLSFNTIDSLTVYLDKQRQLNKTIGFVPTMGALHDGHLSLVKYARANCDISVVSIFVNPTQFNEAADLQNYPRDIEKDCALLREICDVVFIPSEKEVYPEPDTRVFDFEGIDTLMEGEHRPGHFNGVGQVVSRLFEIVKPNVAYFGQKDFQQVAIVRKLVEILNIDIEIIAAPIIREKDGLAMSSRNMLLKKEHRDIAGIIYRVLNNTQKTILNEPIIDIKDYVLNTINSTNLLILEYFDIVDAKTLKPINKIKPEQKAVGCIAVWAGKVRLIDNIVYNL